MARNVVSTARPSRIDESLRLLRLDEVKAFPERTRALLRAKHRAAAAAAAMWIQRLHALQVCWPHRALSADPLICARGPAPRHRSSRAFSSSTATPAAIPRLTYGTTVELGEARASSNGIVSIRRAHTTPPACSLITQTFPGNDVDLH